MPRQSRLTDNWKHSHCAGTGKVKKPSSQPNLDNPLLPEASIRRPRPQFVSNRHVLQATTILTLPDPLPVELLSAILEYALGESDECLLALCHSNRLIRNLSSSIHLKRCGLVVKNSSSGSCIILRFSGNIQPISVSLLTCFKDVRGAKIRLELDVLNLIKYLEDILNVLTNTVPIALEIQYTASDSCVLGHPFTPSAITTLIASLGSNLLSIEFRACITSAHDTTTSLQVPELVTNIFGHTQDNFLAVMARLHVIHIETDMFITPGLQRVLTSLLCSASVFKFSANFPDSSTCQAILNQVQFPTMEDLEVAVDDNASVVLPDSFVFRHRHLENIRFYNHSGRSPTSTQQHVDLPRLKSLTIPGNYTSWTMADVHGLKSVSLKPFSWSVKPRSKEFCHAVRSMCKIMNSSRMLRFANDFTLSISFPTKLASHAASGYQTVCCCGPQELFHDPIQNVYAIELAVERLNQDTFHFILKWINWFPCVRRLVIETQTASFNPTPHDLNKLSHSCGELRSFTIVSELNDQLNSWFYSTECWRQVLG